MVGRCGGGEVGRSGGGEVGRWGGGEVGRWGGGEVGRWGGIRQLWELVKRLSNLGGGMQVVSGELRRLGES
jgi:hypothetical protein